MISNCVENLQDLQSFVEKISSEQYTKKLKIFNGSSIAQHVRHIIEYYQCVLLSDTYQYNYDLRKRDQKIEENLEFCILKIEELIFHLSTIKEDKSVTIITDFGELSSSFYRELFYAMEHSIHHEALIKIGLQELELKADVISKKFGIAPSTIKHQEECVL